MCAHTNTQPCTCNTVLFIVWSNGTHLFACLSSNKWTNLNVCLLSSACPTTQLPHPLSFMCKTSSEWGSQAPLPSRMDTKVTLPIYARALAVLNQVSGMERREVMAYNVVHLIFGSPYWILLQSKLQFARNGKLGSIPDNMNESLKSIHNPNTQNRNPPPPRSLPSPPWWTCVGA